MGLLPSARAARLPAPGRDRTARLEPSRGACRPFAAPAAAAGLRADGPPHVAPRGPRGDPLLPALSRTAEGLLFDGLLRREDQPLSEEPTRHPVERLPAGREDLRDAPAPPRGRLDRGAGARLHRQP